MAKVKITSSLEKAINKKFKDESVKIFELFYELIDNPKKGKFIGQVGGIAIKELKHNSYRFYFVTNGYKIKFLKIEELEDLIIKFVSMSDKNNQQKTVNEIKTVLGKFGSEGFG